MKRLVADLQRLKPTDYALDLKSDYDKYAKLIALIGAKSGRRKYLRRKVAGKDKAYSLQIIGVSF